MATPEIAVTQLAGEAGQPVVVLGPSLGTRVERLWSVVAGQLSGHRVIGWDLPGHGSSGPATGPYSTEELATAVLRAVDKAVGNGEQLRYAGDSFGGCVGLQLLLDHPIRFAAASILCSGAKIATEEVWRERVELVRRAGLGPVQEASRTRWFGRRVQAQPNDESRAALEELMDIDPVSYCRACEALGTFDVRDRLGAIRVPLLAVAGADDLVTTAAQNRELARSTPGARFELLAGVGHLAPLEDPDATTALLTKHFMEESVDEC